uniref:Uncharacterized protein n=1 Tax=Trichogramma kaykai TaxID=54128 RepID=A0ABD2XCH4_9HYME
MIEFGFDKVVTITLPLMIIITLVFSDSGVLCARDFMSEREELNDVLSRGVKRIYAVIFKRCAAAASAAKPRRRPYKRLSLYMTNYTKYISKTTLIFLPTHSRLYTSRLPPSCVAFSLALARNKRATSTQRGAAFL